MIRVLLLAFAFLCFIAIVFGWHLGSLPLLAAGLASWVLAELLGGVGPALPAWRRVDT